MLESFAFECSGRGGENARGEAVEGIWNVAVTGALEMDCCLFPEITRVFALKRPRKPLLRGLQKLLRGLQKDPFEVGGVAEGTPLLVILHWAQCPQGLPMLLRLLRFYHQRYPPKT